MSKTALLVVILSAQALVAQNSTARIQITGRVSKMGTLSVAGGATARQVHVVLRPETSKRTITVPLIARSNASYRVVAKSTQPLRLSLSAVTPNGGTTRLAPEATNVRSIPEQLSGLDEAIVFEGPRISAAGTDATPDNAIRVTLDVEFPDSVSEADLTFTIELY